MLVVNKLCFLVIILAAGYTFAELWNDMPGYFLSSYKSKVKGENNFEACKELCVNETNFTCASVSFVNYTFLDYAYCHLNDKNRLSHPAEMSYYSSAELKSGNWIDYPNRRFEYTVQKEYYVESLDECKDLCVNESSFLCSSINYDTKGVRKLCRMYTESGNKVANYQHAERIAPKCLNFEEVAGRRVALLLKSYMGEDLDGCGKKCMKWYPLCIAFSFKPSGECRLSQFDPNNNEKFAADAGATAYRMV